MPIKKSNIRKSHLSSNQKSETQELFDSVVAKFKNQEIQEYSLIVWVHYYAFYPVALLGRVLEYFPSNNKKLGMIQFEALNLEYEEYSLGNVEAEAILPVIFGDDPAFNNYFNLSLAGSNDFNPSPSSSIEEPPQNTSEEQTEEENQCAREIKRAKHLNEYLKKGNKVIFVQDIPKQLVIKGLIAEVTDEIVGQTPEKLTVRPLFRKEVLKTKIDSSSIKKITVSASTCVPLYSPDDEVLGKNLGSIFYSEKVNKNKKK